MKKLLCLLLTLLLIFPVLAEDAADADETRAVSMLSMSDGTMLAISSDLRILRRSDDSWTTVLSADQISAALPSRFAPDAANAMLLSEGGGLLLVLPDSGGNVALLSLTESTCQLVRTFSDFLPKNNEITTQWTLLYAAYFEQTLYAAFASNFATYSTYALSLTDGSTVPLSSSPIRFLLPLDETRLLVCVNPPAQSIDERYFALMDAASGDCTRVCPLPAAKTYGGFTVQDDSVYFTDGAALYCAAPPYDSLESVGYLPSLDTSGRLPAVVSDGRYCVDSDETGFFSAQLHAEPRCILRIDAHLSGANRAIISQYLRAHPDVAVVYAAHNASTAPEYRQHMASDDALDIYAFTLPNEAFSPLRDKGDLINLRPLMDADALDALSPEVLAPLTTSDGLFAIPFDTPSVSCWGVDRSLLEALGFSDVPATYSDLMTLISAYLTDFADETDFALADNPRDMADALFQQLFWAQLARCEVSGTFPTFADADFVAALRQYIALRPALVDYEDRWLAQRSSSIELGHVSGQVTILSVSSSVPSLLHLNASLSPRETDVTPLLLSFGTEEPLLPMAFSVLCVNRRSSHPDDAASLLSFLLENQPYMAKLTLLPDYAELRPNPAYTEAEQAQQRDEALFAQYRDTLSPLEQKQAEERLVDACAALAEIPLNLYSAEEIAAYHAQMSHAHMLSSSFWVSGDQHLASLRQRFLDGECDTEAFVAELTQIVQMMTLENGISP